MSSSNEGKSTINVRCTSEEYELITNKAKSHGMSISEYVRFVSIYSEIKVVAHKKASKERE